MKISPELPIFNDPKASVELHLALASNYEIKAIDMQERHHVHAPMVAKWAERHLNKAVEISTYYGL